MIANAPENFTLAKRRGLPEELAAIIFRRIESGDFKLGDVLPSEQALAEIYQVSRTVVREALARLKYEGIIMSKRGSGPVVCGTTLNKGFSLEVDSEGEPALEHFFEFRMFMEGEAAAMAAIRRTPEHVKTFEAYLRQMETAIEEQTSGAEPDYGFHCLIAESSTNEYVHNFTKYLSMKIWMRVYSARGLSNLIHKRAQLVLDEHKNIYKAIAAGDPDAARIAAQTHILCSAARQNITLDTRHLTWDATKLRFKEDDD